LLDIRVSLVAQPALQTGMAAMTDRVASEIEGTVFANVGRKVFHPHLVCSWTLDPASHRLSCVWAPPAAGSDILLFSSRIAATTVLRF
jgi:hypothetical protein